MPWYKAGTVSVTLNSNAVIGAGTAFIANSRVGDAFRGPDGGWYEVTNISSDTAMSISPNYQGATNATGIYALAPMQGYVKDSADALRSLVNTYGVKLAALGTTGNYDVLPVTKGGTAGNTPELARAGLELVKMSTKDDMTGGRVITVNDFGLGAPISVSNVNVDTIQTFGYYYVQNATMTPYPNGWLLVQPISSSYCAQSFISELDGKRSTRTKRSTWDAWTPTARGGANSDITSLLGLTTALSVSQGGTGGTSQSTARTGLGLGSAAVAPIVGTASQSGGIPTGAIFERGSNANGEWTKFADGTMICRGLKDLGTQSFIAVGNVFYTGAFSGMSFPQVFSSPPETCVGIISSGGLAWASQGSAFPTTTATPGFFILNPAASSISVTAIWTAIGRWYA